MLQLNSGAPAATPVPIGGGAVWRLRPATSLEHSAALASASAMGASIAMGVASLETVAELLGEEFGAGRLDDRQWIGALVDRLHLLELATLCSEGWDGVVDSDGNPIACERPGIALALRDPAISRFVSTAINARVHAESAEKKRSLN